MTDESAMKPRAGRAQLPQSEQGKSADKTGTFGQDSAPDARAEAHALAQYFPDFFRVDAGAFGDVDTGFIQAAVTSADGSRYWHSFALASTDAHPVRVPAYKLGEAIEPMIDAARAAGIVLHIQSDILGAHIRAIVSGKTIFEDGPHFGLNLARVLLAVKQQGGRA